MELNDYINKLTNELSDKIKDTSEKLLVQDIIMIFKGKFRSYQEYTQVMKSVNEKIDEYDIKISFDSYITYTCKHNIISLDLYNFIMGLRKLYKEE